MMVSYFVAFEIVRQLKARLTKEVLSILDLFSIILIAKGSTLVSEGDGDTLYLYFWPIHKIVYGIGNIFVNILWASDD